MQMCPYCDMVYDESEYTRCPYCNNNYRCNKVLVYEEKENRVRILPKSKVFPTMIKF